MFLSPLHSGWAKLSWVCQKPISPGEDLMVLIGPSSPPFLPPMPIRAMSGCMSAMEAGLLLMLEPCWVTISRLTWPSLPARQDNSRFLSQDRSPNMAMETLPKRNSEATERRFSSPPMARVALASAVSQAGLGAPAPARGLDRTTPSLETMVSVIEPIGITCPALATICLWPLMVSRYLG